MIVRRLRGLDWRRQVLPAGAVGSIVVDVALTVALRNPLPMCGTLAVAIVAGAVSRPETSGR